MNHSRNSHDPLPDQSSPRERFLDNSFSHRMSYADHVPFACSYRCKPSHEFGGERCPKNSTHSQARRWTI